MAIKHVKVAVGADDPTKEVSSSEWNDDHTIEAGTIVNADINASAAIALSKLASDPLARANHTGTQTASTISDYASAIATLTNKTIDADGVGNSITNIENADIKAAAAIAVSKLAALTVSSNVKSDASGFLTTGTIATADIADDAVSLAKMAAGTATHVLTSNGAGAAPTFQAVGAGSITFTDVIPCVMEVPEGTVAYPDIHALATAVAKVSGFVMPDGAAASTINFKVHVPKDLAGTPAMAIRVRIMTLGAVAGPADVRLTVSTVGIADTEALDTALTAETETTVTMPTATETMDYYQQDLTTDWAADDTIIGQLSRDPTDVADDFTDDIMIVGIELIVDRTIS